MTSDLEKLVQQYADLYPYQPTPAPPTDLLQVTQPQARPEQVPIESLPPVLNPKPRDLQLLPRKQAPPPPVQPALVQKTHDWMCQENLVRGVLLVILIACLFMYFRKK